MVYWEGSPTGFGWYLHICLSVTGGLIYYSFTLPLRPRIRADFCRNPSRRDRVYGTDYTRE